MIIERWVREELLNIYISNEVKSKALFAGDTISHKTANECVARGWAARNDDGEFVLTDTGRFLAAIWLKEGVDYEGDL